MKKSDGGGNGFFGDSVFFHSFVLTQLKIGTVQDVVVTVVPIVEMAQTFATGCRAILGARKCRRGRGR